MIRQPAVAGQFYPATQPAVDARLDELLAPRPGSRAALAVMAPHAGWAYSGHTAGIVFSNVAVPDRVILLGPNHRGLGERYAIVSSGAWQLPTGQVPVAATLAAELMARCPLLVEDATAHAPEHCLEVELPFLLRRNPSVQIVPVLCAGRPDAAALRQIGDAIAATVRAFGKPVLLVSSSDMNHYEDQATTLRKDQLALDAVTTLDEDKMLERVTIHRITMCGVAPTYAVLVAAKQLGAGRGALLDYRTSGDVTGDFSAVVGYGAVVIE